jgi:hypothetical protein
MPRWRGKTPASTAALTVSVHPGYPGPDREADHDTNRQRCHKVVCPSYLSHSIRLDAWALADLQEFSQAREALLRGKARFRLTGHRVSPP